MTVATTGAASSAAIAAAIANAVKASGTLVRLEPAELQKILERQEAPLVVVASREGMFRTTHRYLTSYRGFGFYAQSKEPLELPSGAEVVTARQIWMPS
jgi:ABC-type branched-subunit amino acid transport system substrate-binding protein